MLLPHNKVSGGVQDSQIMIPSFFDRFYVMPPLTNGVHYTPASPFLFRQSEPGGAKKQNARTVEEA